MKLEKYDILMTELKNLGVINGLNVEEAKDISNRLLNNLNIAKIESSNVILMRNIKRRSDKYKHLLTEINKYLQKEEEIKKLNEYYNNKYEQLTYTLQYQRNKKLKLETQNKKSIYSNK